MQPRPRSDGTAGMMEVRGTVHHVLPNATFRVALDNGHRVLAEVGGAVRMHYMRIASGDRVTVQVSPDDLRRGRITYWMK